MSDEERANRLSAAVWERDKAITEAWRTINARANEYAVAVSDAWRAYIENVADIERTYAKKELDAGAKTVP
jgi:hypothetical protein